MMTIASIAFAYAAMAALCAAMRRPYASLFKAWRYKPQLWQLRLIASALLIISLVLSIVLWGATVGFSAWWVVLTVPAFIVVLVYTYWPKYFLNINYTVLSIGLISLLWSFV